MGDKYWVTIGGDNWVFGKEYKDNLITLERHTQTAIARHVKVRGNQTPYDGDTIYWAEIEGSCDEVQPVAETFFPYGFQHTKSSN